LHWLDIQRIVIHLHSNSLSLIFFSSWLRNFIGIRGTMGSYKYPPTISISSSISSSSYPTQYSHWQYSVESDNSRITGLVGIYPSLVGIKPSLARTKPSLKFKELYLQIPHLECMIHSPVRWNRNLPEKEPNKICKLETLPPGRRTKM
jgi:hypothetical protein